MVGKFFLKFGLTWAAVAFGSNLAWAAVTLEPPANALINVPANLRRVELSWQASPTDGVLYRVYRSQDSAGSGEIIADRLPVLNYIDTTVSYGATYYYRLAAVLDASVSALTAPLPATPNLSPPTNVVAVNTEQGGEIKISWERPTAGLVLTYNIFRSTSDSNLGGLVGREVAAVEYTDTGLENNTRYYYRVKAVDTNGREGAASQLVIGAASDKKPPAPPVLYGSFESPDRAYLAWSVPTGERGLSYILYRSATASLTGDQVAKTADTSYRQYSLPLGATYYYGVIAIDGSGNVSPVSNQAKIAGRPASSIINTPKATNLAAEGTTLAGEILLRWRVPGEGNVGYSRVYRSLTTDGEPAQIADRVAGSSYLDKTIKAGERYYYTIRLVNKDGVEYQPSDQVSATAFDPANRSQSYIPARGQTTKPSSPAAVKVYAYGKPRLTNLRLEAALANNLRKFLTEKLGSRRVPRILHPVLVKAYLYGGYTVDEITDTVTNGPGLVHPTIPAVIWRKR